MTTGTCDQCGQTYEAKPYMLKKPGNHFCGSACYGEWQREHPRKKTRAHVTKPCETCGLPVTRAQSQFHDHVFCSRACLAVWASARHAGELNAAWLGGHSQYRGPNWSKQRAAARKRDGHKCKRCGVKGKSLPVHHVRPFRLFADYREANRLQNLRTLCPECHMMEEAEFWSSRPLLRGILPSFASSAVKKTCRLCGSDFMPTGARSETCDACHTATCLHCGKQFKSRIGRMYCSRACRNDHVRLTKIHCWGCGRLFRPRNGTRRYCSIECYNLNANRGPKASAERAPAVLA